MLTQTPVGWRPARCVRGDALRRRTALRTRRRIVRAIEMFVQTATKITTRVVARPRRVSRAAGVTRAQNALHIARIVEFAPKAREVAQIAAAKGKAAPPPPPARIITGAQFLTVFQVVFGVYALQFLLIPAKVVSDHFNATADQMTQFMTRGASASIAGVVWATRMLPEASAVKLATYVTLAVAVLYPYGAKFNLFKNNLSCKYPMHYVPEVLMAVLSLAGLYVMYL